MFAKITVLFLALCIITPRCFGGEKEPIATFQEPAKNKNHWRAGYRSGHGLSVRFGKMQGQSIFQRSSRGTTSFSFTRRKIDTVPGIYSEGYVLTDVSGNAGGKTWYWGYTADSQSRSDTLYFSKLDSRSASSSTSTSETVHETFKIPGTSAEELNDEPTHGFEVVFSRELLEGRYGVLGIECGFAYERADFSSRSRGRIRVNQTARRTLRSSSRTTASTTSRTDGYGLGGVIIPVAPYSGTFDGPGPLIDASPSTSSFTTSATRSSLTSSGSTDSWRSSFDGGYSRSEDFEADIFSLRLGPYVEMPLGDRFSLSLAGGAGVYFVDANMSYRESLSLGRLGMFERSGRGSESGALFATYGEARLTARCTDSLSLYMSAQFFSGGDIQGTAGDRGVVASFENLTYFGGGLVFSF